MHTPKKERTRVLLIEVGPELEMGISPSVAILVSAIKIAGFEVKVFSTNEYRYHPVTGDEARLNTLQVPPTAPYGISVKPKKTDMVLDFQKLVKEYKPNIIGISSTSEAMYEPALKLSRSIREKNIFTIAGGMYPTLCPEDVIQEDSIDAVCIGEGEEPLVELCRSFQSKKDEYHIENLWVKVGADIIKNPIKPLGNLDEKPFQDWSPWEIPPRAYKTMAGEIRITAFVELSRGCPFSCNFCANHYLNKVFSTNYRLKSINRFIEEVKFLREKYNLGFLLISDETLLTTSQKRFSEFIEKYSRMRLPFWCQSRPEFVHYERIKLLKEIGLQTINIGIESGNYEFRKKILNRSTSDEEIIHGIRGAVKADVRVGANVIIGFPGESRDNIFETIELVRESHPTSAMIHLFQPYKRTPLREECIGRGLISEDHICGDYRMDAMSTGILSAQELLGIQRTFNLYVDFPKERWDEIREAEVFNAQGNKKFALLAREYQRKHFGRVSF